MTSSCMQQDQHFTIMLLSCLWSPESRYLVVGLLHLARALVFGMYIFIQTYNKLFNFFLFLTQLCLFDIFYICRLYSFVVICYHTLYLPFVYVTFLADFFQVNNKLLLWFITVKDCFFFCQWYDFNIFQEEDLLLDTAYYSEMKDAGFFDSEWE